MNSPLISIVIITYNSSEYINELLKSIESQEYKNIEIIFSDDCSIDNTVEICKSWIKIFNNKFQRCILVSTLKNSGIVPNYNNALKYCKGDWIKYIAGDDILMPNCISNFVMEIEEGINIMSCASLDIYKEKKIIVNPKHLFETNQLKSIIKESHLFILCGATLFVNRDYLLKRGGFDERFTWIEDYPLCMDYLLNGGHIKQISTPLVVHRVYPESVSQSSVKFKNTLNDVLKYYVPKAALKCNLLNYWYHYRVLFMQQGLYGKFWKNKYILFFLKCFDLIWIKNYFFIFLKKFSKL